ncbi:MAG: hypothetical protein QOJ01_1223 [Solirubrobacterales bacterium]|nr:hypothetical protein [Solirubrobacterales bacterium]
MFLTAGLAAAPAMAAPAPVNDGPAEIDRTSCIYPELSQVFSWANDLNWYSLAPGQTTTDGFTGDGWRLRNGAQVTTTTLDDGSTGQVLDLPSGSVAVSPTICVDSGFRTARTEVRNVTGGDGVHFRVAYEGTQTWTQPKETGRVHGDHGDWALSPSVNVQPSDSPGWQLVRFYLVGGGSTSEFQIYNFYVDPRMKG